MGWWVALSSYLNDFFSVSLCLTVLISNYIPLPGEPKCLSVFRIKFQGQGCQILVFRLQTGQYFCSVQLNFLLPFFSLAFGMFSNLFAVTLHFINLIVHD